jgi:exodeoxyribonuclease V alpha subunit
MSIRKSQGSQFDMAAVLLPAPTSRILTMGVVYTAATDACTHLIVAGTEETLRAAVARSDAWAPGLRWRLWSDVARSSSAALRSGHAGPRSDL